MSKAVFTALREMFEYYDRPNERTSATMIDVYLRHLAKYPEPAVLAAIDQAYGECTFRPKIAELTAIMAQAANGQDDLAETAWMDVQREIRRVGYQPHRTFRNGEWHDPPKPAFSNPRIAEAVASCGWKALCLGEEAESRETFMWTYKSLRTRDVSKVKRADFSGLTAIGDAAKAIEKGRAS